MPVCIPVNGRLLGKEAGLLGLLDLGLVLGNGSLVSGELLLRGSLGSDAGASLTATESTDGLVVDVGQSTASRLSGLALALVVQATSENMSAELHFAALPNISAVCAHLGGFLTRP